MASRSMILPHTALREKGRACLGKRDSHVQLAIGTGSRPQAGSFTELYSAALWLCNLNLTVTLRWG